MGMCLFAKAIAAPGVFGLGLEMATETRAGEPDGTRSMAFTCTRGPNRSFNDNFIVFLQCQQDRPQESEQASMSKLSRPHVFAMQMKFA